MFVAQAKLCERTSNQANQTDLDQLGDKTSVIEAFFTFAQAEQQREAQELIDTENLNAE
ncbi:hypothetical protein L7A49_33020, partial [Achromobacter xylosoxidans]|nr:hypothetical protein [Achromobacter xylosoxidans]